MAKPKAKQSRVPPRVRRLYVREWRLFRGMTQIELADKAKLGKNHSAHVSRLEQHGHVQNQRDGSNPLVKIARALRIEIDDLYRNPFDDVKVGD